LLGVNKKLTELADQQKQMSSERSLSFIGKQADIIGNSFDRRNGEALTHGVFKIAAPCQNIVAIIKDHKGEVVKSLTLGRHEAGKHVIAWDGLNDLGQKVPDGNYEFTIQASMQDGKMVNVEETFQRTSIVGLTDIKEGGTLETITGKSISTSDIQAIFAKESLNNKILKQANVKPAAQPAQPAQIVADGVTPEARSVDPQPVVETKKQMRSNV